MTKRIGIGVAVVLVAILQAYHSMAGQIEHLQTWDGIYSPSLLGPFVDNFASTVAAFIAGQVLPTFKLGD